VGGGIVLTGKLVRVRNGRDRILPYYLDVTDPTWQEVADRLLEIFRKQEGRTRGGLEEDLRETFGSDPSQLVPQGLAKLLEDRCTFEVISGHPPEQIREAVFRTAAAHRLRESQHGTQVRSESSTEAQEQPRTLALPHFDRAAVLHEVADTLGLTPEAVEQGLFADLKSEQRLVSFKDITAVRLLQRYNVALAQAVLLRSIHVQVTIRHASPQRYRQLFRLVKFHRLVCRIETADADGYVLHLDGPLSLFSATQKYGLQLALFLPAVLLCRDFNLHAELHWGPQRTPKKFTLTPAEKLVSHYPDTGTYVPPELGMFVELFRKKITDWEIAEDTSVLRLGEGFWVPDFRLTETATGRTVLLDVLGFWRRSSVEQHLERLRQHARQPYLLAISEQLRIDDADLEGLPASVYRFRQMPLPDEVARRAREILEGNPQPPG
jgi:predicted nuclease of restriction endonuclease-like RecB superfamily